jgi:hypothetical protein
MIFYMSFYTEDFFVVKVMAKSIRKGIYFLFLFLFIGILRTRSALFSNFVEQ